MVRVNGADFQELTNSEKPCSGTRNKIMTKDEQIRLNEVIFCTLFQRLLKQNVNPIKVYDLLTSIARVAGINEVILNSVITILLNNDRRYVPAKGEYLHLMRKSLVPVRRICQILHISQTTYYSKKYRDMQCYPRFDPLQYQEMMKVLMFFRNMYDDMEGVVL